jgi:hypothetical protein
MLLSWCRAQEIPVVLVSWPNHPAFLKVFQESRLSRDYEAGLERLLGQYPVPVINLNRELPGSQSETEGGLFADPRHLTPQGAEYFSRRLAMDVLSLPQAKVALQSSVR